MFIDVDSKKLKVLNDINQVVKKPFDRYYFLNNVVFANLSNISLDAGVHFSYVDPDKYSLKELLPHKENHVIELISEIVYKAIKDYKKVITKLSINDDKIYLTGDGNTFLIGRYVPVSEEIIKLYETAADYIKDHPVSSMEEINEKDKASMYANEIVNCGSGDKRIRLTKPLLPNITMKSDIYVKNLDIEDNPNIFSSIVLLVKSNVLNYHIYNCVKF